MKSVLFFTLGVLLTLGVVVGDADVALWVLRVPS